MIHKRVSGIGALYTLAGMTYPCVLFGIILVISVSDIWWQTLLTACLATWVCDSAALFGGMRFGKHKLAPAVSPKKTVEGALSGLLSSVLSGLAAYWILGLSTPVSLRLCLLVEETLGMVKEMVQDYYGCLWFSGDEHCIEIHLEFTADMDAKKKHELLSVSSTRKRSSLL